MAYSHNRNIFFESKTKFGIHFVHWLLRNRSLLCERAYIEMNKQTRILFMEHFYHILKAKFIPCLCWVVHATLHSLVILLAATAVEPLAWNMHLNQALKSKGIIYWPITNPLSTFILSKYCLISRLFEFKTQS